MRPRTLLAALSLIALTACSGLSSTPTPTPLPPTLAVTPTPATPTPSPPPDVQPAIATIRLWLPEELSPYAATTDSGVLLQQLTGFSDTYPDVRVEVVAKKAHGRGGLLDFLRTARDAAPSVMPDLMIIDAADMGTATAADLIYPVDDLLSPSTANDRFPFATAMGDVEGQTMGFVVGADMQHAAYRPQLLESPVISWMTVISAPSSFLFPARGIDGYVNDATLIQYLAAGGSVTDADGNPSLDRGALADVLGFYSDAIASGVISPTVVLGLEDADQSWERFLTGEDGLAVVRAGRYWREADETMAAAPIPTQKGERVTIARGWTVTMVAKDPARQALAMLLLDWLIAPDHSARWTQAEGYLPATQSALLLWDVSEEDRAMLRDTMMSAVPPPPPEVMAAVGPILQDALESVLRGRATPRRAADVAVENLEL